MSISRKILDSLTMDDLEEYANMFAVVVVEEAERLEAIPARIFLRRHDAFAIADHHFVSIFRLSKALSEELMTMLVPFLQGPTRTSAIDIPTKVLIALRFFATGSYQNDVGHNIHFAVSQPTVSRCIKEVSVAINNPGIMDRWISFPQTINELTQIRNQFYQEHNFPGVIGCIDCTHVAIIAPAQDEHLFVNRKRYHSINVQLICDTNLKILNVNARFPGSSHDTYIWNQSNIQRMLIDSYRAGQHSFYLLGDSGYPLRPWLLTPLETDPPPNTPEAAYNISHKRTRATIERCNGVLKMRFRCLLKHRVLNYSPFQASKMISACAVLHNMCVDRNIPLGRQDGELEVDLGYIDVEPEEVNAPDEQGANRINPDLRDGRKIQRRIITQFFN